MTTLYIVGPLPTDPIKREARLAFYRELDAMCRINGSDQDESTITILKDHLEDDDEKRTVLFKSTGTFIVTSRQLELAHLLIAYVGDPDHGVTLTVGSCLEKKKPILLIAREGELVSTHLRSSVHEADFIHFRNNEELSAWLRGRLQHYLRLPSRSRAGSDSWKSPRLE